MFSRAHGAWYVRNAAVARDFATYRLVAHGA